MAKKKQNKFITVGRYDNGPMAHIMKSALEQEGLECNITDEKAAYTFSGLYTIALGGVKLKVKAEDLEKAKEIIKAIKLVNKCFNCNEEIEAKKYEKCEKCGHQEEKPDYGYSLQFMIIMTILALFPYYGIVVGLIGLTGFSYKETRKKGIFIFIVSLISTSLFLFASISIYDLFRMF